MKDEALALVAGVIDPARRLNLLREYVQALALRSLVNRHRLLALQHYDLASLMAGKLHALCTRTYPKGRDWYDLLWYVARVPPVLPNLRQLQNALDQTKGVGGLPAARWPERVLDRAAALDFAAIRADVQPFLEHAKEAALLTPETIRQAIGRLCAATGSK